MKIYEISRICIRISEYKLAIYLVVWKFTNQKQMKIFFINEIQGYFIMKVCNLYGLGYLRYEEVAAPSPKEGEVLLKIKASGICGSDISRIYSNNYISHKFKLDEIQEALSAAEGQTGLIFQFQ
jgi:hypothetical protein